MKTLSIILALLLVFSVIATAAVFADVEDTIPSTDTENATGDLGINDQQALADVADEANSSMPGFRHFGNSQVTFGQGYATSENNGYLIDALWVSQTFTKISDDQVKSIRNQYKNCTSEEGKRSRNCTAQVVDSLKQSLNESVQKKVSGRLQFNLGNGHENFKLVKNEFTNDSVSFDVYSINSMNQSGREKVGTLNVEAKTYSDMVLWTGELVLNSGKYAGTYDVSIASKTRVAKGLGLDKAIKANGNGKGNGNENPGNGNRENGNETSQPKKGFWSRFAFWRKN